ncbi:unnamed protein product [Brugia timori]|uniref:Transmembrane protein n=1 Tax=Brugia timori TaxID=42155 RepID=A0A0R3QK61_9BILA|nr:unnamed protein product [Brugia timori]
MERLVIRSNSLIFSSTRGRKTATVLMFKKPLTCFVTDYYIKVEMEGKILSKKALLSTFIIVGLPNITHNIVHKCTIITRRVQSICSKLWMLTISKKVKVGELPIDPDSIIALALYTVLDTYVIVNNIVRRSVRNQK